MKAKFADYLKSIGMTKTNIERVETIHKFYKGICPDEITDVFVSEYLKEDGSREYENIWFFSQKYCMEAKLFLTKDDFDITPIWKRIEYLRIEKQDYDFKKAKDQSRLFLHFTLDTKMTCDFKASKENCDNLRSMIVNFITPNWKG